MNKDEIAMLLDVVRTPEHVPATLEERVTRAEDRATIVDLVMAYGWLCDSRRWDELLDLYTDDFERRLVGTLDEHIKGKDALREVYERPVLPRAGGAEGGPPPAEVLADYELRHMIHPPVVRISDDGKRATVAAVYSLVATSGDGADLRRGEHEGGYVWGLRKVPGVGWRFDRLVVISENARNPLFRAS